MSRLHGPLRVVLRVLLTLLCLLLFLVGGLWLFERFGAERLLQGALSTLNEQLKVKVETRGVTFTLLSRFPRAALHLRDVTVLAAPAKDLPKGDTLLSARDVYVEFALLPLLRREFEIEAFRIERGFLSLKVSRSGQTNYDIFKPKEQDSTQATRLALKAEQIELQDVLLGYDNARSQLASTILLSDLEAGISLQGEAYAMRLNLQGLVDNLSHKGRKFLEKEPLALRGSLSRQDSLITLEAMRCEIASLGLEVEGRYNQPDGGVHLIVSSHRFDLPEALRLLRISMPALRGLELSGGLGVTALLEGTTRGKGLHMQAELKGKSLKGAWRGYQISIPTLSASCNVEDLASMRGFEVKVDRLQAHYGSSTLDAELRVSGWKRPSIYAKFKAHASGSDIPLEKLAAHNPRVESLDAEGEVVASFPSIAEISLKEMRDPKLRTEIAVRGGAFTLTPAVTFDHVEGEFTLYDRDLTKGVLTGNTLGGRVEASLNARDLLGAEKGRKPAWVITARLANIAFPDKLSDLVPAPPTPDTTQATDKRKPVGMDLRANLDLKDCSWRGEQIESLRAEYHLADGATTVRFNDARIWGGGVEGLVEFQPKGRLSGSLTATSVDVHRVWKTFDGFGQKAVLPDNIAGNLSATCTFAVPLDSTRIDPQQVRASASVRIAQGRLRGLSALDGLSKFVDIADLRDLRFGELSNTFTLAKGRVSFPRMQISSQAFAIHLSGEHALTGRYLYRVRLNLSEMLFNRIRLSKPSVGENSVQDSTLRGVALHLSVEGDRESCYVKYDGEALREEFRNRLARERGALREAWQGRGDSASKATRPVGISWDEDTVGRTNLPPQDPGKTQPIEPPKPADPPPIIWED